MGEFEKYQELKEKGLRMQEDYERQLEEMEEKMERTLEEFTDEYEGKLQELNRQCEKVGIYLLSKWRLVVQLVNSAFEDICFTTSIVTDGDGILWNFC